MEVITTYKRHLERCKYGKKEGSQSRAAISCGCPVWAQGVLNGIPIRKSTGLTSMEAARELVINWEDDGSTQATCRFIEIGTAVDRFLADVVAREMSQSTVKKYRVALKRPSNSDPNKKRARSITLEEFAADKGNVYIHELTTDRLREFRERQLDGAISASKKLERLKSFFNFCVASGWLDKSPAAAIKPPSLKGTMATLPISDEEIEALHKAIPALRERRSPRGPAYNSDHMQRLAVLLRVLEYSGLRISDAVKLSRDDLKDDKLFLFRQEKTKEPVRVPLPPFVVELLESLPLINGRHYFYSGEGKMETAAGNYRRTLRDLRALIGNNDIHPHRWRDTFAVRLLEQGVPVEVVSRLLGHRSIEITQAHYSPWVRRLQVQAEEAVSKVWEKMGKADKKDTADDRAPAAKIRRIK